MVSGLGPDTPLGRMVAIRAEEDKENIQNFSKDQRRIWNEWRNRTAKQKTEKDTALMIEELKNMFIGMAGENVAK